MDVCTFIYALFVDAYFVPSTCLDAGENVDIVSLP